MWSVPGAPTWVCCTVKGMAPSPCKTSPSRKEIADMTDQPRQRVRVIDSHTGGEPTRVVLSGGPDLGESPLAERLNHFRAKHDAFRSAVVNEPRGSDVMVGPLLCRT